MVNKVCDVVLNSVWYDPRVMKQIKEYKRRKIDLFCVGLYDNRFSKNEFKSLASFTNLVCLPPEFEGPQKSFFRKIRRELIINKLICREIIKTGCNVIHANDLNALIPAYKASRKLKCKLIYDSHEIYVENFFSSSESILRKLYNFIYKRYLFRKEKKLVKKVDLMVCVSNSAADYFKKKYNIKKPTVVTNCPSKSKIKKCVKSNTKFEVLNQGLFYPGRGYEMMVQALPFFKKYNKIILAVRGFGSLEEKLKNTVATFENKSQFKFYRPVKTSELIDYAKLSSVGVAITLPICINFKYSVSNKIFEYAAAGLPVIMSNIPEHLLLNEKYNFGIVLKNNNVEDFVDAVIKLYKDKKLYNELKNNSLKLIKDLYWEKEFDKIIKFIQEV